MLQGNTVIIKIIVMSNILFNPKIIKKNLCAIFKGGRGDVTGQLDTAPDHPGHQGDALALPDHYGYAHDIDDHYGYHGFPANSHHDKIIS